MKIEVLDHKITDGKSWFLGKISLWDYLSAVKPQNFEFDVQRGIVKNRYLDSILQSVDTNEAIPPITITVNDYRSTDIEHYIDIDDGKFNILDGLQRTYRLWLYKAIAEIAKPQSDLFGGLSYNASDIIETLKSWPYYIHGVISVSQIKTLLDSSAPINITRIQDIYRDFFIYLYVWSGLSDKEVIQKMLILNAGQRKVSIGHQYELMFLQIIKDNDLIPYVKLIREKEDKYSIVKAGNRNIGEFIFSSTIIGIQSLIAGKPIRLSPDNLELGTEDDYISENQVTRYFNQPFLNIYLNSLYELDYALSHINVQYLKWFVKDTTISGIMGAIGLFLEDYKGEYSEQYKQAISDLKHKIELSDVFDVTNFYLEYSKLSSQKISIGDKVRMAIYNYTLALLKDKPTTWSKVFMDSKD